MITISYHDMWLVTFMISCSVILFIVIYGTFCRYHKIDPRVGVTRAWKSYKLKKLLGNYMGRTTYYRASTHNVHILHLVFNIQLCLNINMVDLLLELPTTYKAVRILEYLIKTNRLKRL